MVKKRDIYVYCVTFVLFAGSNCQGLFILGTLVSICSNIFLGLILLDLLHDIVVKRNLNVSFITISYMIYVCLYIGISLINGSEMIKTMLISLFKWVVGFLWIEREVGKNSERLTGAIMYAFISWCIIDGIITIMYPTGAPFLSNGYVLGWKNNKIMHLFGANLLLAFKYLKMKRNCQSVFYFQIRWFLFFILCVLNANIVESSTTTMVITLLFAYMFFSKIINKTLLVNGKFIFFFHTACFILLIFVREVFQQPLNDLMQILFQKDATFTGRIYIWQAALLLISNSFFIGYGDYGYKPCIVDGGGIYEWNVAHNQILECMMEGGIVLTALWVYMVWRVMKLNYNRKTVYSKAALFSMFSFLFFFHTEAALSMISFFIFYVFYCMSKYEDTVYNDYSKV